MEKYTGDLKRLEEIQAAVRMNKSARKAVNAMRWQAGASFLDRIHAEIFNDKGADEQAAIKADLEALARGDAEPDYMLELERPELTVEYLRSIGYEPF